MNDSIIWLASYPKSGNTWFRAILTAHECDGGVDLDDLDGRMVVGRAEIDRLLGVDSADLPTSVLRRLVPAIYRAHAAELEGIGWAKTHDMRALVEDEWLHPRDVTRASVYLVRDPRDVAVSFAHHLGIDIDGAIRRMANPRMALGLAHEWADQRLQMLGTWSEHVMSWIDDAEHPAHVVRYEDLSCDPVATVTSAMRSADVDVDEPRIGRAVDAARFDRLAAQERARGFAEVSVKADRFFRAGIAGGWRSALTPVQARRIVDDHGGVMEHLGYDTSDD